MALREIVINPVSVVEQSSDILNGTPVFSGTRVPVQTLFDYLEEGNSFHEFLDDFPTVTIEQVVSLLHEVGKQLGDGD
jgi:uncharacterized protein (DUF433 family)